MKYLIASVLTGICLMAKPNIGHAQVETFLGQIVVFPYTFCPQGYTEANGALLPINQNQALFSLLGTTYGGNGITTFALPTAKPIFTATRATLLQCIALSGVYPSRN